MKLLMVNDTLLGGGKERRLVQLALNLSRQHGVEVHIAVLDREKSNTWKSGFSNGASGQVDYPEILQSNTQLHFIERKIKKDPLVFFRLWNLIRKVRPDILHVWSIMGGFYTAPLAFLFGIPMISSFVADCNGVRKGSLSQVIVKACFSLSKYVTGNSSAGLVAYHAPLVKSRVIYNGFDFRRLMDLREPNQIRSELGVRTKFAVVMVARFDDNKDYQTYIEAANKVTSRRSDVSFICLGQGPNQTGIQNLAEKSQGAKILFPGFRTDVESVLNSCDISVLCTNQELHQEGISNSILESCAMMVPAIATDGGGSPEIISHGLNGFLVPPNDPDKLAEQIELLLNDESLREQFGIHARDIVQKKFSIESMVNGFLLLYQKVIDR